MTRTEGNSRNTHGVRTKRLLAFLVVAAFVLIAVASYHTEGIIWSLSQNATAEQRVDLIKAYFEQFGAWGPLAYLVAVTVEVVVAPIPGTALYLPGGVLFGWFVGGTMSLLGNVLGAGIACTLSRYALAGATARLARMVSTSATSPPPTRQYSSEVMKSIISM